MSKPERLILASSSPTRAAILKKLNLPFITIAPNIDERPHKNETAEALVRRLANTKANAVAQEADGLIIAADQVGVLGDYFLTKPKTHENALKQLKKCSNHRVDFFTALSVLDTKSKVSKIILDKTQVFFRTLTDKQIAHYLALEKPYQCAGGFKCEGLGIALFSGIESKDINALMGLPLISLIDLLLAYDIEVL